MYETLVCQYVCVYLHIYIHKSKNCEKLVLSISENISHTYKFILLKPSKYIYIYKCVNAKYYMRICI